MSWFHSLSLSLPCLLPSSGGGGGGATRTAVCTGCAFVDPWERIGSTAYQLTVRRAHDPTMPVFVSDHPVLKQKLTLLRNKKTDSKTFRDVLNEITTFLGYEATRDLELRDIAVDTPVAKGAKGHKLKSRVALIPVLRSGLGMVDSMTALIPFAPVFHIGLYRHKDSMVPVLYYERFPTEGAADVAIVLEPMIATAATMCATMDILKKKYGVKQIKVVCAIASRQGLSVLADKHPDVIVHCCAIDEEVDANGHVVPGLGDIGDRQFRTKVGKGNWNDNDEKSTYIPPLKKAKH